LDTSLKIGNDVFTVSPLAGESSFLLQPKILPLLPDVGALVSLFATAMAAAPSAPDDATEEAKALASGAQVAAATGFLAEAAVVVARLCAKMPSADLKEVMRTLLEGATMNGTLLYTGQGNPINVLMQGRTIDIWRLLAHALKVSYPDFFGLLGAFRGRVGKAGASATSSTSSPGPAGES
jgi:hypothetical protein